MNAGHTRRCNKQHPKQIQGRPPTCYEPSATGEVLDLAEEDWDSLLLDFGSARSSPFLVEKGIDTWKSIKEQLSASKTFTLRLEIQ